MATAARSAPSAAPAAARTALVRVALVLLLSVGWVLLTNRTGATYHFFPLVLAATPAAFGRLLSDARLGRGAALVAGAGGLLVVGLGWLALVALEAVPTTTFVRDQFGGVSGETAAFALLGAALGAWWGSRPAR